MLRIISKHHLDCDKTYFLFLCVTQILPYLVISNGTSIDNTSGIGSNDNSNIDDAISALNNSTDRASDSDTHILGPTPAASATTTAIATIMRQKNCGPGDSGSTTPPEH